MTVISNGSALATRVWVEVATVTPSPPPKTARPGCQHGQCSWFDFGREPGVKPQQVGGGKGWHDHLHGPVFSGPGSSGSSGWAALLSAAVIAASVTAFITVILARRKSREEERSRIRTVFAEALEAIAAYKEFPYAIRRRDVSDPGKERVRLSEELRRVQTRLTYYTTWINAESKAVGDAYESAVDELRTVAGGACRDAWNAEPISADGQMNIGPDLVDLSSIKPYETAYATTAEAYLASYVKAWPWSTRSR